MAERDPGALLDRIRALTGARDLADAERAARATVSVLLEALPPAARPSLDAVLPAALRARTDAEIARPSESLHAFYERVAAREGLAIGTAVEHAQCVCRALAELLDDDTRARLARALPDALDALLARPEAPAPRPPHTAHHSPPSPHDLAAGRPGSRQPLADAAPHSAHTHSLARSDAPHADTKLSSSSGTTQEREAETLAQGHPGSERPLGEG